MATTSNNAPEVVPSVRAASEVPPRDPRPGLFLTQLSRAVQRASIYPAGHPAASQGVGPLVLAFRELGADGPVSIAAGRTRLLVAVGDAAPIEHESRWLAARLFDRTLSALAIEPDTDAAALGHLVSWLASPASPDESLPEIAGIQLTRFDGTSLHFREDAAPRRRELGPEAIIAWRALTAPLRRDYGLAETGPAGDDPIRMASRIQEAIHAREGTGIARLCERLVEIHADATTLDPEDGVAVGATLAILVERLSPELRGSLLSVGSADPPEKVALVSDLIDTLPSPVLCDIAASLDVTSAPISAPFARFLRKLSKLSASDPALGEVFDRRVQWAGLAVSVPGSDDDGEIAVLEEERSSEPTDPGAFVPAAYGARLTELSDGAPGASAGADGEDETMAAAALDDHLARILTLELRKAPDGPDAATYLQRLLALLPAARQRGALDTLGEAADALLRVLAAHPTAALERNARQCQAFFAQPVTVSAAVEAIAGPTPAPSVDPVTLLAAGGQDAAHAAVEWIATSPDPGARERVAAALVLLDLDIVRQVVLPAVSGQLAVARAFAASLGRLEASRATDLALHLMAAEDTGVRRAAAAWLFHAGLSAARLQRVLQRALDDDDPGIVADAVTAAAARGGALASDALLAFVLRHAPSELRRPQVHAVRALIGGGEDGINRLADALAARRLSFSADARRRADLIASELERSTAADARRAAARWRWSPAGVFTAFVRLGRRRR